MRPYVSPSTHPFSVNLYLGLIGVSVGVLEHLAAHSGKEKDTYFWAISLTESTNNRENMRAPHAEPCLSERHLR